MRKPTRKDLRIALIGMSVVFMLGFVYFRFISAEAEPGDNAYRLANRFLEKGEYHKALANFAEASAKNPNSAHIVMGRGLALMQLDRDDEARAAFDETVRLDPDFAEAYANRGILNDRTGNYEAAIRDYRKAAELKPKLNVGPGWIKRLLYNIQEEPPTILRRAEYLEAELKKPEAERVMIQPEAGDSTK